MITLGIESSCDETSACVLKDQDTVLANIVYTQIAIHQEFGGVVPEIASRHHLKKIVPVINGALAQAECTMQDIDLIAVSNRPGLVGSLLVGISAAKGMASVLDRPLVDVNHIEAHFFSCLLENPDITFPAVGLIVSGGHTHIFYCKEKGHFSLMGQTRDDAAGESYDKVAKMLGLGYPGGPLVDACAEKGDAKYNRFPRAFLDKEKFDFSFSGLKTSVRNFASKLSEDELALHMNDICASFQDAVTEVLVTKTIAAAQKKGVENILVAGGVACNSGLKKRFLARAKPLNIQVHIPRPALCTDNAAMVAANGYFLYKSGYRGNLSMEALPSVQYPLDTE